MIHEIEHRRNYKRARDYTDHERHLLLPRSCFDQLAGLEVLQIIVRDSGNVEDHSGSEERECHQRFTRVRRHVWFYTQHEQQGSANHHQNANARQRAVGGTDQARHVTADGRDEEAHQHNVGDAADDERW